MSLWLACALMTARNFIFMTDIKKDDVIELDVTDLNNLGNGVGRYPAPDGKVVFVRGAVSGERVRAKIIKVNAGFAVAKLIEVISPSPYRCKENFCAAPLSCGGCVYRQFLTFSMYLRTSSI